VKIVTYKPERFPALRTAAERMNVPSLRHQPFADWYYATSPTCKLWMALDGSESVVGVVGVDAVPFEHDGERMLLGFGSNFHASQKGVGGILFLQWLKSVPVGAVFGGTEMTHAITRKQNWTYFSGIKTYFLNRGLASSSGEPIKNRILKSAVKMMRLPVNVRRRAARLPTSVRSRIEIAEERVFSDDLLPTRSPFRFRCAADADYFRWRYDTNLSFTRYRLFRVRTDGRTAGYVIIHETAKRLTVAHADGQVAADLAYAVLMAVAETASDTRHTREVQLASSHPEMQAIFADFGFRPLTHDRPLALGSMRGPITIPADTSRWMVNFDWSDNCLRLPFRRFE